MQPSRREVLFLILSFSIPFVFYCLTLSPSVSFTDSGELAASCATLGVAHPTGYPLFILLGFLWVLIPFPFPVIFKLNLFAAFCTAFSSMMFFKVALLLLQALNDSATLTTNEKASSKKKKKSADPLNAMSADMLVNIALLGSLMFAFSRTVWAQATAIEVYSLHLVMLLSSLWLFLRAMLNPILNERAFLVWAFVLGLGFCNHLTMILLAPAMVFLYFNRFGFVPSSFRRIGFLAVLFLFGISVYLYLPIRSAMYPDFNWGEVHRGLEKFLYHASGKQYQVNMFNGNWQPQAKVFFSLLPFELAFVGFIPMFYGAFKIWRLRSDLFWFLFLLATGCFFYSVNYNIHDIDSYFLLAFLAFILFASAGMLFLVQTRKEILFACFFLPILALGVNFKHSDKSNDRLVLDYTRNMIDQLEPNAVILSAQWDYFCSAFWYLQDVEGYRSDVVLIEKELLRRTWYVRQIQRRHPEVAKKSETEMNRFLEDLELFESSKPYDQGRIQLRWTAMLKSLIEKNLSRKPIYLTADVLQSEPELANSYQLIPQGFALRVATTDSIKMKADFHLDSFLNTTPRNHLETGILQVAAVQISRSARFASSLGETNLAQQLSKLSAEIQRKIQSSKSN